MPPPVRLYREAFADSGARDAAVSRALLTRVASGELPESLRLYRPGPVVAFSPLDATHPGFERAVAVARERGFDAARRLAGGRAAVFHEGTLAFSWCVPDAEPRERVAQRFERAADWIARSLRGLGVDARIGAVPGEYCPGDHSVNARGLKKLMGVGQRLVRGAAHVGGVIVLRDAPRVRDVLVPVYDALDFEWDPGATGSIEEEIGRERATHEALVDALLEEFGTACEEAVFDPESLALATDLEPQQRP